MVDLGEYTRALSARAVAAVNRAERKSGLKNGTAPSILIRRACTSFWSWGGRLAMISGWGGEGVRCESEEGIAY
jgi:hypothetical protein